MKLKLTKEILAELTTNELGKVQGGYGGYGSNPCSGGYSCGCTPIEISDATGCAASTR